MEDPVVMPDAFIGASVSEPHTSKLNGGIFLICVYIYVYIVRTSTRTRAAYGQYARDPKSRADPDTFIISEFLGWKWT